MRRTRRGGVLALVVALLVTTACADTGEDPAAGKWRGGQIYVGTGNTTGVYYQLGGGLADIITRNLDGYQARAEPTGASGDNVERIAGGDMDLGFSLADTAADGYQGRASFAGRPQKVQAIARIYRNYTHVIVRKAAQIRTFADLRGKRVSTGSANSGTDVIAGRLLTVAGIDPDADVTRLRLSLPETVKRLRAGEVDALFWSGACPLPASPISSPPRVAVSPSCRSPTSPSGSTSGTVRSTRRRSCPGARTAHQGTCRRWRWRI